MSEWFASGRVVDMILAILLVEGALLVGVDRWRMRHGRKASAPLLLGAASVASVLLPGACLLLALRAALTGGHWSTVAGFLTASLVCHLADLANRWRASDSLPRPGQRPAALDARLIPPR